MYWRKWMALLLAALMLLGMLPAALSEGGKIIYNDNLLNNATGVNITHEHKWTQGRRMEPTCTEPGSVYYTCNCGESRQETLPALGHSWDKGTVTTKATCSSTGVKTFKCTRCGATRTETIPANSDHKWGKWKTKREATCSKKGQQERKCSVCGATETRDIKKKDHTYGEWTVKQEPTCAAKGLRVRVCSKCGHEDEEDIDPLPHTYGEWTVTREPTCTAKGEKTATCQVCGHFETQSVDMIPHSFGDWVVISPLTDWSVGIRERTCSMCGLTEQEVTEPAGTHKKGDKGEGVKDLQDALNDAGYNSGKADGDFGKKTESAVKNVEKDHGKPDDGIAWPGVMKILLGGVEYPEDLKLTVTLTSSLPSYPADATATFDAVLENTSGLDLDSWTLYQMSGNDVGQTEWLGVAGGGTLGAGEQVTITGLHYTVGSTDAEVGGLSVYFYVSASAAGGKTLYSNEEEIALPTDVSAPGIILTADKVQAIKWVEGSAMATPMTLYIDSNTPLMLDEITVDSSYGGAVSDEAWMSQPLEPHMDYHFTITSALNAFELGSDWAYRTVKATVHDPNAGDPIIDGAHAFYVPLVDGPSLRLLADDTTGLGGGIGDLVAVPMQAVNNGSVDLSVSEIESGYPTDKALYNHAYDALFAAGDSFPVDFVVEVLSSDAHYCSVNDTPTFPRTVFLRGYPIEGGPLAVDSEEFALSYIGPVPKLKLTMTQITPDQPTWSPDGAGHIADIEYDCVVENTGDMPVLLEGLYCHVYPDSEAAFLLVDLGSSILLDPEETCGFKATLPIGTGNITPGSASETIDGLIEADFGVVGLDPSTLGHAASSDYSENVFTYKVKLGEYDWVPPEDETPAIAISVEDTTGKGGKKGEQLTLTLTISNVGKRELKDLWLDSNSADGALGTTDLWTLPAVYIASFKPGESFTLPYTVDINGDDANYAMLHAGKFNRWLIIHGADVETDQDVSADVTFDLNLFGDEPPAEGKPAIDLTVEDTSGLYLMLNDTVSIAVTITNTGKTELKDVWLESSSADGTQSNSDSWVIPATAIASFPAGDSFDASYVLRVDSGDADYAQYHGGKFNRLLIVHAKDAATGAEVLDEETPVLNYLELPAPPKIVYGDLEVVKSRVGGPDNGSFYVENEEVTFQVDVTNHTGQKLKVVTVYDPLVSGGLLTEFYDMADGATESATFKYTVTAGDVATLTEITNVANVHATGEDDTGYIALSNPATAPIGEIIGVIVDCAVTKTETTTPKNHTFYTEGEVIGYDITVTNSGEVPLDEVVAYDTLKYDAGGELGSEVNLMPSDSRTYHFDYTVDYLDCVIGTVNNDAYAIYWVGGYPYIVWSDTVTSLTGFDPEPGPTIPGDSNKSTGDPDPEPDPDPHDGEPQPGKPGPDTCRRTLVGAGENRRAYTLDYCSKHRATWSGINAMLQNAGSDDERLAVWQKAVELWTADLNAEYRELLVGIAPENIPTVMNEQAMFYLQLNCRRAALALKYPDDPATQAMKASEMLMNKCADMCYERHTAPEDRIDSLLTGDYRRLEDAEPGANCERAVEPTATGAKYTETACAAHAELENASRLLATSDEAAKDPAKAMETIKRLWLTQLDAQTNARYRAANADDKKTISAERMCFGDWLKAREALLNLRYPDRPEVVAEVLADAIRARVLDVCGE